MKSWESIHCKKQTCTCYFCRSIGHFGLDSIYHKNICKYRIFNYNMYLDKNTHEKEQDLNNDLYTYDINHTGVIKQHIIETTSRDNPQEGTTHIIDI